MSGTEIEIKIFISLILFLNMPCLFSNEHVFNSFSISAVICHFTIEDFVLVRPCEESIMTLYKLLLFLHSRDSSVFVQQDQKTLT